MHLATSYASFSFVIGALSLVWLVVTIWGRLLAQERTRTYVNNTCLGLLQAGYPAN